jgi:hypothetical protein
VTSSILILAGSSRLHGRLSVYYTAAPPSFDEAIGGNNSDDEESEDITERDDETIINGGDAMFGLDDDDFNDDQEQDGAHFAYQNQGSLIQSAASTRRIRSPPQDVDVKGGKTPPQVALQKVEKQVHKASRKVAVEVVSVPAFVETTSASTEFNAGSSAVTTDSEKMIAQADALRNRKAVYDEFDRLLGLQSKSANPVMRIMSSFMGPLMRMMRVLVFLFRIMFHVSTWRDPFLSFWFLVFLSILCLILIVFPWRSFFFLVIAASLGPQVCRRNA